MPRFKREPIKSFELSETCVVPDGGFEVILVDFPWHYNDKLNHHGGSAGSHYEELKPKHLKMIDLEPVAADDCVLLMWVTAPQINVAVHIIDHWAERQKVAGIPKRSQWDYKTIAFVWRKLYPKAGTPVYGQGRWTRSTYEYVLLISRGRPSRVDNRVPQMVDAKRGEHSTKPLCVYDLILQLMGDVPRMELFARIQEPGWESTGLELDGVDIRDTVLFRPEFVMPEEEEDVGVPVHTQCELFKGGQGDG